MCYSIIACWCLWCAFNCGQGERWTIASSRQQWKSLQKHCQQSMAGWCSWWILGSKWKAFPALVRHWASAKGSNHCVLAFFVCTLSCGRWCCRRLVPCSCLHDDLQQVLNWKSKWCVAATVPWWEPHPIDRMWELFWWAVPKLVHTAGGHSRGGRHPCWFSFVWEDQKQGKRKALFAVAMPLWHWKCGCKVCPPLMVHLLISWWTVSCGWTLHSTPQVWWKKFRSRFSTQQNASAKPCGCPEQCGWVTIRKHTICARPGWCIWCKNLRNCKNPCGWLLSWPFCSPSAIDFSIEHTFRMWSINEQETIHMVSVTWDCHWEHSRCSWEQRLVIFFKGEKDNTLKKQTHSHPQWMNHQMFLANVPSWSWCNWCSSAENVILALLLSCHLTDLRWECLGESTFSTVWWMPS